MQFAWYHLMAGLIAAGCVSAPPAPTASPLPPAESHLYVIQSGDVLKVVVWRQNDLDTSVTVRPDGMISCPLVGDVQAEGFTIPELRVALEQLYADYVREPKVTVAGEGLQTPVVHVFGEVRAPASYRYRRSSTLVGVLSDAGGIVPWQGWESQVRIIRGAGTPKPAVYKVDVNEIMKGDAPDVPLYAGDIVYVPSHYHTDWSRVLSQILGPVSTGAGAVVTGIQAEHSARNAK